MKSGDTPNLNWPFFDGEWGSEKEGHVRMKNTAVFLLTAMGVDPENITEEKRSGKYSVDVYAEPDGLEPILVECETDHNRWRTEVMYEEGHKQYVLTPRGFYEVAGHTYQILIPVNIQGTLGTSGSLKGRWYADGRQNKANITPSDSKKPLSGGRRERKFEAPDEYHRWKANGEEKREQMYTADELFEMYEYQ